ncbi:energy-coupling factor ABC transporter ATP-binding protein [Geosporobacter ferrireducens]|uniref:ABC transporter ATP-binding protein n=1 Tax=Geosporobacter ferrireducens TaxID=1424294 RepID=A0A1D8GDZ4_9FIRM|nr:ATP-binding cassette domain-containing protein [Geosporobacter ferrireducens]AOT69112.1 energy-coupling factor ABC transporter ATP-binding protein [Geosporobacter ferrireducens]
MTQYIIQTKELEFSYPDGTKALNNMSIAFEQGKKIAIIGPNGAGKTTLFLTLNGVHRATGGKIYYHNQPISYGKKELLALRKNVGIVFQDPNIQLFSANVFQEVSFGPINLGMPKAMIKEKVMEALSKTDITYLKDRPTHFLSGGQKKRVSIADILAMEPEVIFLDEPTAFVDPKTSEELMNFFDLLNHEGKTIVLSTHDIDKVYPWADYVFVMKDGTLFAEGVPEEIFQNEKVLCEADLQKPWIIEVYEALLKSKPYLKEFAVPKSKQELFELMEKP